MCCKITSFLCILQTFIYKNVVFSYMIMDDQYFSFDASSKIYSVKDILRY